MSKNTRHLTLHEWNNTFFFFTTNNNIKGKHGRYILPLCKWGSPMEIEDHSNTCELVPTKIQSIDAFPTPPIPIHSCPQVGRARFVPNPQPTCRRLGREVPDPQPTCIRVGFYELVSRRMSGYFGWGQNLLERAEKRRKLARSLSICLNPVRSSRIW